MDREARGEHCEAKGGVRNNPMVMKTSLIIPWMIYGEITYIMLSGG
jgi:hypothetical protein